jgi:hypothetical protein
MSTQAMTTPLSVQSALAIMVISRLSVLVSGFGVSVPAMLAVRAPNDNVIWTQEIFSIGI